MFVRALAIGGEFLHGNIMIVGPLEDRITWNGKEILKDETSSFEKIAKEFVVKATRGGNASLVQDLDKQNKGVLIDLPLGVSLVVNRLQRHVNVAIKMVSRADGQDGLCGNANGVAADDTIEFTSDRKAIDVSPLESLFLEATS